MRLTDNWFNGLAESEAGQTAHLHVRDDVGTTGRTKGSRIEAEVVVGRLAPLPIGHLLIVLATGSVGLLNALARFVFSRLITSL